MYNEHIKNEALLLDMSFTGKSGKTYINVLFVNPTMILINTKSDYFLQ